MPALGVVMIVKNESACLAACLESVHAIADEIVVGDTGSTDDTAVVAARFDARIFGVSWNDDFAEARNRVLAEAKSDWLLHMDADEVLHADCARRIRDIVDADGAGADAIEVTLANYCDDIHAWRWIPAGPDNPMARGWSGYIPAPLLRLFRNGRGFQYREPVHENITESVIERGGLVRAEPIIIHHYGYGGDTPKNAAKRTLYLDIARRKVLERQNDPKAWYDLAEQSIAAGDPDTAENACRHALGIAPRDIGAATTLANILLNRGDLDEVRALIDGLERERVSPVHLRTALGAIAYKQGRLPEARDRLASVTEQNPGAVQAWLYLARTLDCLGEFPEARRCLEQALAIAPGVPELKSRLRARDQRESAEHEQAQGAHKQALALFVESLRLDPEDPITYRGIGQTMMALGFRDKADEMFARALCLCPGIVANK